MKIIHLTDIHSDFTGLSVLSENIKADMVLISGDITHFGDRNDAEKIISKTSVLSNEIYAVTGNCDYPDCSTFLSEININAENKIIELDSFQLVGLAGSLPCPGSTPYEFSDAYYKEKLTILKSSLNMSKPVILLTHQPPYGTKNDKVLMGWHVGSKAIRSFIEEIQPVVCLTGHIHEGKGVDFIGECPVINPGPARNKHFAIIELTDKLLPKVNLY